MAKWTPKLEVTKRADRPDVVIQRNTDNKYPLDQMKEVDDYFEVPKEWYFGERPFDAENYSAKKHRDRVNNAVRGYALRMNTKAAEAPDFDQNTFKPMRFSVAALENGNIGVWRDQ